jgi:CRP/FNR family transcriptional regulator, cyclic AMP receptor protein
MARKQQSSADALEQVPLLSGLNARARGRLAKTMKERSFPAGRDIVVEGHTGMGFFVILGGSAVVSIGGDPIRTLGPGDYFGEMALIHGEVRTATVTAKTPLTCLTISPWAFKTFVQSHPNVAWTMLENLVRRVKEASAR